MSALEVAATHQRRRRRVARAVEVEGVRRWRQLDHADLRSSWSVQIPRVAAALTAAQLAVASQADSYVDTVAGELDVDAAAAGAVVASSLSGLASDGRPLPSLLSTPLIHTLRSLRDGAAMRDALASGEASLRLIARTEVADAGRVSDGIAITARQPLGWVRMVNPPSCARCAILAGKFFRYNSGFQRHPGCDCTHIPAPESRSDDLRVNPRRLLDEGQIRGLSKADTKAIVEDGADMNRVVNAQRGMYTAAGNRKLTTELSAVGRQRLRPETIYRDATSRDQAVQLLRLHGYIA